MLILASEELYTSPATAYRKAIEFLELTDWTPNDFKAYKQGVYEEMPASAREHLINYYRPYNQKLYDYLKRNFDWDK